MGIQLGLAHRTVRCPRLADIEPAALGNRQSCTTINHRIVQWCTRVSGESSATNSSVSGNEKGDVAKNHRTVRWCTGLSGEPTALAANGRLRNLRATRVLLQRSVGHIGLSGVHRTVSGAPTSPEEQRSDAPDMEGDRAPDMNSGCRVHHSIEGRNCLPSWSPTAPSCLEAVKETPMRMEENTKHSLSILRHPDSAPTHLIHCVSDLSSIRVVNSLCCPLSSSLHLCA
jgi:hypothetical protein